jgi:hypothetical protein
MDNCNLDDGVVSVASNIPDNLLVRDTPIPLAKNQDSKQPMSLAR